jgi:uncharacterized protein YihD (DUF1040 family)
MHKIHIRHIFQVLIPIHAQQGELEISQQLLDEGDQFGFALTNKPTNEVFQYHLQLVDADKIGQPDADRPNCFVWPKRIPILFKNEDTNEPCNHDGSDDMVRAIHDFTTATQKWLETSEH